MQELLDATRAHLAGEPYAPRILPHPYAFNLFSHNTAIDPATGCNGEETKVVDESRKILADSEIRIGVTCIRVPVLRAHAIAMTIECEGPITPEEARVLLTNAPRLRLVDDRAANHFPMPSEASGQSEILVDRTMAVVAARVPVFVGIGGNSTAKVIKTLQRFERFAFTGIVSVCPYYNRPTQEGMREHFTRIAEATDRQIVIYNIPYRTGVNLANDTMLALAELPNIVGFKDSSGSLAQSIELLRRRPRGFAVMTGEDNYFYTTLAHGGDGGILASAHIETRSFVSVYERMGENDHRGAHQIWSRLETLVPLLSGKPNPMPIKYCLWRQGLIRSPECRLPLTRISPGLAQALDRVSDAAPAKSVTE